MEQLVGPLILLLVIVLVALLGRALVDVVVVHDYERGLRYRGGKFSGLLAAGTHFAVGPFSEIRLLDGRPTSMLVEGQEILTADGIALKVSLAARYVVGDPVAAVSGDQSFIRALHLELQLALRETLAAGTVDEILAARSKVGPAVLERAASNLARLGIELLAVEVRDLMVPGELKRVFAGVVTARKEGEASLERVRAETAALRNLANAGRLIEDNPGVLQLRLLQQLGETSGNTVMLTMPDGQGVAPGGGATRPGPADAGAPTPRTKASGARARASGPPTKPAG
ncbi:MAG TPA: slipin family protein [Candidatus Limnocylindrales bacterium]|nr:slipin family protein [Candidatus Limnocylindrales bacterium]